MAGSLLWFDGFDNYGAYTDVLNGQPNYESIRGGNPTFSASSGRYGGGTLTGDPAFPYMGWWYNNVSMTEVWIGGALSTGVNGVGPGNASVMGLYSASGLEVAVQYNPTTSVIKIVNNVSTTLCTATIGFSLTTGSWNYYELHAVLGTSSNGSVEFYINGQLICSASSVTTAVSSDYTTIAYGDGPASNPANVLVWFLDDIYIWNGSSPGTAQSPPFGDIRVKTLLPASDAGPNNGTPSTGVHHYAVVDQAVGYNTGTYNTISNTSGQEELYGVGTLGGSSANLVFAVRGCLVAELTDAGPGNIYPVVVSGSTEHDDSVANLPGSGAGIRLGAIMTDDPNTGSPWTWTAAGAIQIGAKVG